MTRRIIGVGNRYVPEDSAGPRVIDLLARQALPDGVEAIDGGLAGLDLLRFMEGARRVILVDTVTGFARPGEIVVLRPEELSACSAARHDHAAGLTYLLKVLPAVLDGDLPRIRIVGLERPLPDDRLSEAAAVALALATDPAL
ncbi:MAG: hydrogenase maturation protease [Candidatus Riflebacteria bacterium]|nr:hydrogenase maturation protease [Candidatus Riflebacteria bacterium]